MAERPETTPREKTIKKEKGRLRRIMKDVPERQRALCDKLIDRAAFMLASLIDYEEVIENDGILVEMCQGKYTITCENPAAKGYNTMFKNYQAVIKQLGDLLPDPRDMPPPAAGKELLSFIESKGKK